MSGLGVLAGIAAVSGPALFLHAFGGLRVRRLIQNTPTSKIRSMPMGLVEVTGAVEARSTVSAPFSGRECVFWEVDISTRTRRNVWKVVHRNVSGHPFYVRDATGTALVYPQGALCRLNAGVEEECAGLMLPDCYSQYLKEQHLGMGSVLWRAGTLRFRERTLENGQSVYVLGTATPPAHAVSVSDDELSATGTDDLRARTLRRLDHEVVGVIRRGDNERTFILSQSSERELTLMLGLQSWGGLFAGPLLTIFGLGYWLLWWSARGGR